MATTEYLIEPATQEIVITRVFEASRERVFEAFTDPQLVAKWLGPRRLTTAVETMDVRPGGMWRFINRDSAGNEFGFHGVYHDVVAPERIVQTFEYEGEPGHVLLQTATFEDLGGTTKLIQQAVFQSVEDRDGMVRSGMREGSSESMDRLAELLAKA
ncbi:ATPase [bacterium]|nr:MAG: ATPase [bacterium]